MAHRGIVMRLMSVQLPLLVLAVLLPADAVSQDKKGEEKKVEPVVVTDKDNGGKINVKKGATLKVKLPTRGGVPYTWKITMNNDKALKQEGKVAYESVGMRKKLPGGPRLAVFTFTAVGTGESKLELTYTPVVKVAKKQKTFSVTVIVNGAKAPEKK
jgi:predicted secreted protein